MQGGLDENKECIDLIVCQQATKSHLSEDNDLDDIANNIFFHFQFQIMML